MDLYEKLSAERKELQAQGLVPEWYSTAGWQMFKERYLSGTDRAVRGQFERIAATAARHLRHIGKEEEAREKFFQMLWDGWLSPSTPVLSNMGTNKGMPISCSGTYVGDEITEFFGVRHETAMLTKNGFGTAAYLGDIRPRGSKISRGGKASGVLPVFKGFVQDSRDVSQGTRRGAWAGYLPIDHGDFDELADFVMAEVDDCNVGWNVSAEFIEKLDAGDPEAVRRYQKAMKMKMVTGRGYFFFPDKANAKRPPMYVERGLDIKAPQLCNEIMLHSSKDYTYTCVLSNMNLVHYDTWKDTDAVFWATVFLDCVISEFLEKAEEEPMLHKAVAFTRAGRALGLGVCGFHTYLQNSRLAYEGLEAHFKNIEIFKHMLEESKRASVWMAQVLGEPEWCVGHGVRNTHNIALPPTKSCMPGDTVIQTASGNMSYFQILEEQGIDTEALTSIKVQLEGGKIRTLKYDDQVTVMREGRETIVFASHLRIGDGFDFETKASIVSISSNAKTWFNLERPVAVVTPGGVQTVERFFFNGFEQHYDIEFENDSGDIYRAQSTGNHKYQLLSGEWVETENLERGMECHAGWKVKSVVLGQGVLATMDVEVPEEHCYLLANGVVSHNTALLMGGVSEGISPDPAMTYTQTSAAGEVDRIVVPLLNLMKERGVYTDEVINDLVDKQGSVQHVTWLTDEEKAVFKTAFEINQKTVLRMAAARAKYIDQWQSLNLFFAADEDPAWISECHKTAFHDPDILGLYYIYTQAGVQASKGECEACQ